MQVRTTRSDDYDALMGLMRQLNPDAGFPDQVEHFLYGLQVVGHTVELQGIGSRE